MAIPDTPATLATVDAVIDVLGGTSAVASLVDRQPQAVSNARARGQMPSEWYFVMSEALRGLRLSAPPGLWGMVTTAQEPAEARP